MAFLDFLFGGNDSRVEDLKVPDWWTDPNYQATQDFLQPYGFDILKGNIPDYYKGIGEVGGSEFDNLLKLTNRDIMQGTSEALARTGRGRGGALASVTSQALADNESKLRFSDFMRAMEGKQWLFGQGKDITEGVRTAGLNNQGQRNQFNLGVFDRSFDKARYLDGYDRQSSEDFGNFLGTIGGATIGAVTGGATGGPMGALIGGLSGATGTGTEWLDMFNKGNQVNRIANDPSSIAGVSSIGRINSKDIDLMDFWKNYSMN